MDPNVVSTNKYIKYQFYSGTQSLLAELGQQTTNLLLQYRVFGLLPFGIFDYDLPLLGLDQWLHVNSIIKQLRRAFKNIQKYKKYLNAHMMRPKHLVWLYSPQQLSSNCNYQLTTF